MEKDDDDDDDESKIIEAINSKKFLDAFAKFLESEY